MKRILFLGLAMAFMIPSSLALGQGAVRMQQDQSSALWASLSSAQKERLQALHRRFLTEVAPLQGSLIARHLELKALWSDPKATPAALEAKEQEALDLLRQIQEKAVRHRLEARSFLSPDQIVQFHGGFWLFRGRGRGGLGEGRGGWAGRRGGSDWGHWGNPNE